MIIVQQDECICTKMYIENGYNVKFYVITFYHKKNFFKAYKWVECAILFLLHLPLLLLSTHSCKINITWK